MRKEYKTVNGHKHLIVEYEHTKEFWDDISRPIPKGRPNHSQHKVTKGAHDHYGSRDFEHAMSLSRYGWPEGLAKMRPFLVSVNREIASQVSTERELVYDIVGETPDVGSYMAGIPEHMVSYHETNEARRVVRIVYNAATSSCINKDQQLKRGAVACVLADAIEKAGMRCELYATVAAGNAMTRHLIVPIKRPDEALNLDRVAFFFGNASFERRLEYKQLELMEKADLDLVTDRHFSNYGCVKEILPELQGDIYFGGMNYANDDFKTPESAIAFTLKHLEKLGIKLEGN